MSAKLIVVCTLTVYALCRFTNARMLFERIDQHVEWKHGHTYVPKGNKRLLCFLDDMTYCQVNVFIFSVLRY